MKKVLLVTDGFFHPSLRARKILRRVLESMEGYTFSRTHSLEKLPADLDSFVGMVLYIHHKHISNKALEQLDQFVASGGGLLGLHSATASFKNAPHYSEILGGRFTGHGPVGKFTMEPVGTTTIFSDMPAFEVFDELYLHEIHPEIQVCFTAEHQGKHIPAVWTHTYGKGRVLYAVPGHTTQTLKHSTYQKLLKEGLAWVTEGIIE